MNISYDLKPIEIIFAIVCGIVGISITMIILYIQWTKDNKKMEMIK